MVGKESLMHKVTLYRPQAGPGKHSPINSLVSGMSTSHSMVPNTVLLMRFLPLSTNSFRDEEVNWENVRILPDGEAVSVFGTRK